MRALHLPQPPGILCLTPFCCCEQVYSLDLTLPSVTPGCTDPGAVNHDPAATVDDGSCSYDAVAVLTSELQSLATGTQIAATSGVFKYTMTVGSPWTLIQLDTTTGIQYALGTWDGTGSLAFTGGEGTCNNGGGREASVTIIAGPSMALTASEPQTCVRCHRAPALLVQLTLTSLWTGVRAVAHAVERHAGLHRPRRG